MKKFIMVSVLCVLSGCTSMSSVDTPPTTTPATPVFFQPFSAALDEPALSTIASVAKAASQQPDTKVFVTGAADSVGSAKANKYLSETRAQVVADALAADGVDESRIHIRALGIVPPTVGPTGTPAQSARRVLIQLGG
jgi:outer membrane protein OmpA-like peptidoglycan-associated protein